MKKAGKKVSDKNKTAHKTSYGTNSNPNRESLKKQYVKSGVACKVTFKLPKEAAAGAKFISIVGDFNNWNLTETPMKRLKNGDYSVTLELPCHREYKFKYLIDGNRWENDWCADNYIPNPYGGDDSVVVV